MSTRRTEFNDIPIEDVYSSSPSIYDCHGAVNIGCMSGESVAMGIVGDDVQYEANRYVTGYVPEGRGRMNVPTSVDGDDGSHSVWNQGSRGSGIDLSCIIVGTADRESARSITSDAGGDDLRTSAMEGPFVDRNVNDSMKGRRPRHLLKKAA